MNQAKTVAKDLVAHPNLAEPVDAAVAIPEDVAIAIQGVALEDLTDEAVLHLRRRLLSRREDISAQLLLIDDLLGSRMLERGAKAIPDPVDEVTLEPKWSGYAFDLAALRLAGEILPADERAKLIKHVAEIVPPPIPAHDEPGNPVSIAALIRKYAGSQVADLLERGMRRDLQGYRVKIQPRKA